MGKVILSYIAIAASICVGTYALFNMSYEAEQESRGIFSWQKNVFADSGAELFLFMQEHGFTELYQWFSSELDDLAAAEFLNSAHNAGIDTYILTGGPSWAKDSSGEKHLKAVERAVRIAGSPERKIKGIVFDVEPHTLEEWGDPTNRGRLMASFADGMKAAYKAAANRGFEVIVCIPNHYDDSGYFSELQTLVSYADRVAVMNYARGSEDVRIETEAGYAKKFGKGIINIYEFNPPGHYGIEEGNTYYFVGFDAALLNFRELAKAYQDTRMTMAAHDYEILKELLKQGLD